MLPEITRTDVFRLETKRLWLRWAERRDEAEISDFAGLEEVATMTASWPFPLPPGEVVRRIDWMRQSNSDGRGLAFVIERKPASGRVIGLIGGRPVADAVEEHGVGYMLAPGHWGQGLMSEALGAYRDAIFRLTAADRLVAYARTVNPASRRVLEKAGFRHVATTTMDMPARGAAIPVDRLELERALSRQ
ncbi:MAG: GNAT family N-acetyltransferase [Hyphomicrobiaceae bacterium]